jgi:ABC-type glycerol-3-phosphate transport system substrate-binding protein
VVDDRDVYEEILNDYRKLHPFVDIEFRRFRLEEYENELLNALAEDRGPDVFLIHNTWLGKYQSKIYPMPLSTKVAVQTVEGTLKKEVVYVVQTEPSVSVRQFKLDYPDSVSKDFIRSINVSTVPDKRDVQQRILAIPMSVDTLAMYVNKDLLNAAGVLTIPTSWDQVQEAVKKLTKQDTQGDLVQAGAALGTGNNVERAPDLLAALMMQNGAEMSSDDGNPTFNTIPAKLDGVRNEPPALQALAFYTDFANPGKEVYTWNAKQPNSLDAFTQGKVAMFFGYNYHLPIIRARGSRLNLALAPLPQIPGNPVVNFASYWGLTVSKKTKNGDLAWNLLNFMRTPEENVKYLKAAQRPAALRAQLADQLEDENIGVFAAQVLTSQTWYRGANSRAADTAFIDMIDAASIGTPEAFNQALQTGLDKVQQTIRLAPIPE